jgi:transposase
MARVSQALPHLSAAEILEKIRTTKNFRRQQKWWIVYNALVDPRTATKIAQHTGTTERLVHQVISDYNRKGVSAIETPGKGGRRSSYLSQDEEQAFLYELEPQAKRGQITTKAEVKQAFEQRVGKGVHKTTIYRLLQRHSWRKLKPRPQHPKADVDDLAHFQQTFEQQVRQIVHQRESADVRPVLVMATDEGRFGRTGEVRECWCPPRFRPTIAKQQIRQYLYVFTAVAPALGKLCSLILPFANTAGDESVLGASVIGVCPVLHHFAIGSSGMASSQALTNSRKHPITATACL